MPGLPIENSHSVAMLYQYLEGVVLKTSRRRLRLKMAAVLVLQLNLSHDTRKRIPPLHPSLSFASLGDNQTLSPIPRRTPSIPQNTCERASLALP